MKYESPHILASRKTIEACGRQLEKEADIMRFIGSSVRLDLFLLLMFKLIIRFLRLLFKDHSLTSHNLSYADSFTHRYFKSIMVLIGKMILTLVPISSCEDIFKSKYSLSHNCLHKYSPMPVAFSKFLPFVPVKPFSNTFCNSFSAIPMP